MDMKSRKMIACELYMCDDLFYILSLQFGRKFIIFEKETKCE